MTERGLGHRRPRFSGCRKGQVCLPFPKRFYRRLSSWPASTAYQNFEGVWCYKVLPRWRLIIDYP